MKESTIVLPADTVRLVPIGADPEGEFRTFIKRQKWPRSAGYLDDSPEWSVPGTRTVTRWAVDGGLGVGFIVVQGPERVAVAARITAALAILEVAEFPDYLGSFGYTAGRIDALFRVAIAAPGAFDQSVFGLLQRDLWSAEPLLRRAALVSAGIIGWPEFCEPVAALLADPVEAVRKDAGVALEMLAEATNEVDR